MSWFNNLRDLYDGTRRSGSHRLKCGRLYAMLLGVLLEGLVCSPFLAIGLPAIGLVRLCRRYRKKEDRESHSAVSDTESVPTDATHVANIESTGEQSEGSGESEDSEWDAQTAVDQRLLSTEDSP